MKGIRAEQNAVSTPVLKVLHVPMPPKQQTQNASLQVARVLTSQDCRKRMEEKEEAK
jgi:hypothetical protein